ncbi:DUF5681 domain-containing protein [Aeromonas caviae]|uniref:DUF5681 domain-containing protein n=1 Tax=Aeromonas hydrophila TaxID=644 RepID=UPI0038D259E4
MAQFKPGQSGNPAGKPKGAVSARTKLLRDASLPTLQAVIEKAKAGDLQAASLVLDRTVPRLKPGVEPVAIVDDADASMTLTEKAHAVSNAILQGRLDPVVGAQVLTAMAGVARIAEMDELSRRIEQLEGRSDGQ